MLSGSLLEAGWRLAGPSSDILRPRSRATISVTGSQVSAVTVRSGSRTDDARVPPLRDPGVRTVVAIERYREVAIELRVIVDDALPDIVEVLLRQAFGIVVRVQHDRRYRADEHRLERSYLAIKPEGQHAVAIPRSAGASITRWCRYEGSMALDDEGHHRHATQSYQTARMNVLPVALFVPLLTFLLRSS